MLHTVNLEIWMIDEVLLCLCCELGRLGVDVG